MSSSLPPLTYGSKAGVRTPAFADGDGPGSPDLADEIRDRLPVLAPRAVPAGLEQFMRAPTEEELYSLFVPYSPSL
jgi:hypothetical protein